MAAFHLPPSPEWWLGRAPITQVNELQLKPGILVGKARAGVSFCYVAVKLRKAPLFLQRVQFLREADYDDIQFLQDALVFYRHGRGLQRSLQYLAPVQSQVRLGRAILSEDILVSTTFEFTHNIVDS
jgi:hypothetical protein